MRGKSAEHLELMLHVFRGMEKYCRASSAEPFDAAACTEAMLLYLDSMSKLSQLWRVGRRPDDLQRLPWHLRQKCHMLPNLVLDQIRLYGSPTKFWCYRDEIFVGVVNRICSKTGHPSTLESQVLLKLRILEALTVKV